MAKAKDLTGLIIGKLTVIKISKQGNYYEKEWLCQCSCGNIKNVKHKGLTSKTTLSCGCLQIEHVVNMNKETKTIHNLSNSRIYKIWQMMKDRCLNSNNKDYINYGDRGIAVCEEWLDFNNFHIWSIKNGYNEILTIDRINNNKGYCPENCRWETRKIQSNNTRRNRYITLNGEEKTLQQWADYLNISKSSLSERIQRKWTEDEILNNKRNKRRRDK